MKQHFIKTMDFMFDTFEQMIQEFEQNPSIALFEKLEKYFNIIWYTYAYRNVDGRNECSEYRYIKIKHNFDVIKSMMEEVERHRLIQTMLQTPGFNNRYNL